ncbi:MAG: hypothetical protein M1814_006370 [Vezdaea aestivalis]|nr:MAG: hypothetical protein M1814_006370 [Vezdaea aestivalis]
MYALSGHEKVTPKIINNFLQARLLTPNVDLSRLHELNSDLDTEMDELGHLMTQLDTNLFFQPVRASLINAPECSLTPIPIFLQAALRSHSLPLYPNAQTLCAHPLFTGRTSPSMGGYCYRPPSSTRSPFARPQPAPISELYHLVFPPTTRSPAFSHCATITARTKYGSALGIAVQMYCRAVCDCGLFTLRSVGRGTTGKTATNDALEQVRAFLNRVWAEDSSDAETEDGASESGDQPANQELAQGWQHEWDSVTNRTKEEELERKLRDWLARAQAAEGLEPVEESGDGGNGQCSAASQCGIGEMCRALGREGRNLVGWCVGRKGRGGFLGLGVVGTRGQRSERGD